MDEKQYTCGKCNKNFSSQIGATRHARRKIMCNRVIECTKCNKIFTRTNDLKKHRNRKTSCGLIHGNPTVKVGDTTCVFCRKQFSNKYNVRSHHKVCKIKNGGMDILFDEVRRLKEEVKSLKAHPQAAGHTINSHTINTINSNNTNNHFNTTMNINFINFGDGDDLIKKILDEKALEILGAAYRKDLPFAQQITDRVVNLVGLIFRNPDHKELQGVYVVDLNKAKENAFYYEDGEWILSEWLMIRSQLLTKLYDCLSRSPAHKKNDILNIIKYIFVLGTGSALENVIDVREKKKLTLDETTVLYKEIADSMTFDTVRL